MSNPVQNFMRRLLPPHVDVVAVPEYELRHGNGDVDTFDDIGDAVEYQERFPTARLFRREVTSVAIRSPWTELTDAAPRAASTKESPEAAS